MFLVQIMNIVLISKYVKYKAIGKLNTYEKSKMLFKFNLVRTDGQTDGSPTAME
jgi:hypothetical protein